MHTKISSGFWSHPDIEPLSHELKLAALWLLTHERLKLCGYAEVTDRRFAFETGLSPGDCERAIEALPKLFTKAAKGYWVPNFIRWQFGAGKSLARSHMSIPLVNDLHTCPPEVVNLVLLTYPELQERSDELRKKALQEGSESPTEGQRAREGEGEGASAGEGAGTGAGAPSQPARAPRPPRASSTRPADHPEPMRSRMVAVAEVVKRDPDSLWSDPEKKALAAAGLLAIDQPDFDNQVAAMKRFYLAVIPEAKQRQFWKRSTLPILLNNWPSELDKARLWAAERDGGSDGVRVVA